MNKIDRTNERKLMNCNVWCTIIKYINVENIVVKFDDGYETKSRYMDFKNGRVKSPLSKDVYNIGYVGMGDLKTSINGCHTDSYNCWKNILRRCYNSEYQKKCPTYIGCTVCEGWHNFQNFAKWYDENYYEIENQKMHLDKDILHKGNRIYCPQNCMFVPERINTLFVNKQNARGEYPLGVTYFKRTNKFRAQCNTSNNHKNTRNSLGYFNTPEEAFNVYKQFKEKYIKQIADEYKDKIPKRLYDAMYNWVVEITD